MPSLFIKILRFTDDSFPGWVECCLVDAWGKEWLFVEKVPVVSSELLDNKSNFPKTVTIDCQIIKQWYDEKGREIITVDTSKPLGIKALNGTTLFDVLSDKFASKK